MDGTEASPWQSWEDYWKDVFQKSSSASIGVGLKVLAKDKALQSINSVSYQMEAGSSTLNNTTRYEGSDRKWVVRGAESLGQISMRRGSKSIPMSEDVWGDLPVDLFQRIAAFLPLSALPRLRLLNKTLNDWILSAEFCRLCTDLPLERNCIMYQGANSCKIIAAFQGAGAAGFMRFVEKWNHSTRKFNLVAATENVLYVECTDKLYGADHYILCDLTAQTCTKLPPRHDQTVDCNVNGFGHVTMACDGFRVMLYKRHILGASRATQLRNPLTCEFELYDSQKGRWKTLCFSADFPTGSERKEAFLSQSVILFDKVYVLILEKDKFSYEPVSTGTLFSLDIDTFLLEDTLPSLPKGLRQPHLLARGNSLLLIGVGCGEDSSFRGVENNRRPTFGRSHIEIWSVDPSLATCVKIAQVFYPVWDSLQKKCEFNVYRSEFNVVQCDTCIYLKFPLEFLVVYDLVRDTWNTDARSSPIIGGAPNFPNLYNIGAEAEL